MDRSSFGLIIVFLLAFIANPRISRAQEEHRFPFSLEPILSTGRVFELTKYASTYTGKGALARYELGEWFVTGRYRLDEYKMSYFGLSKEAVDQVLNGQPVTVPVLPRIEVSERKAEKELQAGRSFREGSFAVAAGWRVFSLKNDFSSMESSGPSIGVDGLFGPFIVRLDGAVVLHTGIQNHRTDIFVLPEGERTLSFYGEPKAEYGWLFSVRPFSGRLNPLSFGYEGSMIVLKYGYRYYHGVTVRARF